MSRDHVLHPPVHVTSLISKERFHHFTDPRSALSSLPSPWNRTPFLSWRRIRPRDVASSQIVVTRMLIGSRLAALCAFMCLIFCSCLSVARRIMSLLVSCSSTIRTAACFIARNARRQIHVRHRGAPTENVLFVELRLRCSPRYRLERNDILRGAAYHCRQYRRCEVHVLRRQLPTHAHALGQCSEELP
jgi:hypothetical protein